MIEVGSHCMELHGASWFALFLTSVGRSPSAEMLCPRYSTEGLRKEHFVCFNFRPASARLVNTLSKVSRCSCFVAPVMSNVDTDLGNASQNSFHRPLKDGWC